MSATDNDDAALPEDMQKRVVHAMRLYRKHVHTANDDDGTDLFTQVSNWVDLFQMTMATPSLKLAASLLQTRLVLAFRQIENEAAATKTASTGNNDNVSDDKVNGSSENDAKLDTDISTARDSDKMDIDNANEPVLESIVSDTITIGSETIDLKEIIRTSDIQLPAASVAALFYVASDLATVHQTILSRDWTSDWSVASIALSCYQFWNNEKSHKTMRAAKALWNSACQDDEDEEEEDNDKDDKNNIKTKNDEEDNNKDNEGEEGVVSKVSEEEETRYALLLQSFMKEALALITASVAHSTTSYSDFQSLWDDLKRQEKFRDTVLTAILVSPGFAIDNHAGNHSQAFKPSTNNSLSSSSGPHAFRVQQLSWQLGSIFAQKYKVDDANYRTLSRQRRALLSSASLVLLCLIAEKKSDNSNGSTSLSRKRKLRSNTDAKTVKDVDWVEVVHTTISHGLGSKLLSSDQQLLADFTLSREDISTEVNKMAKFLLHLFSTSESESNNALITDETLEDLASTVSALIQACGSVQGLYAKLEQLAKGCSANMTDYIARDANISPYMVAYVDETQLPRYENKKAYISRASLSQQEDAEEELFAAKSIAAAVVVVAEKEDVDDDADIDADVDVDMDGIVSADKEAITPKMPDPIKAKTLSTVTALMELNEWFVSLICLEPVEPSTSLISLLSDTFSVSDTTNTWETVVIGTLNDCLVRFAKELVLDSVSAKDAAISVQTETDNIGRVVQGYASTTENAVSKAAVSLFYHALESFFGSLDVSSSLYYLGDAVLEEGFFRGIFACCAFSVVSASCISKKVPLKPHMNAMPLNTLLSVCNCQPQDFLAVSKPFISDLSVVPNDEVQKTSLIQLLPKLVVEQFARLEYEALDSQLWNYNVRSKQSFPNVLSSIQASSSNGDTSDPSVLPDLTRSWQEIDANAIESDTEDVSEYNSTRKILRSVLVLARERICKLCFVLNVSTASHLVDQSWLAIQFLLRKHADLLIDRHLDQFVLCSVFGVARSIKYKPTLTFTAIVDAYIALRQNEIGLAACNRIVRRVKITQGENGHSNGGGGYQDVIVLYNKVYIPGMKSFFLDNAALTEQCQTKSPPSVASLNGTADRKVSFVEMLREIIKV